MNLNSRQLEAVKHEGHAAVEAGAGTGKTHLMAHRFIWLVQKRQLSPLEIVAVTFTKKAAQELRARIRATFEKAGIEEEKIYELEAAQISTLHSLAARICREHPLEAGVNPSFQVMDELEMPVWLSTRLPRAMEEALDENFFKILPFPYMRDILLILLRQPLEAEKSFDTMEKRFGLQPRMVLEQDLREYTSKRAESLQEAVLKLEGKLRKLTSFNPSIVDEGIYQDLRGLINNLNLAAQTAGEKPEEAEQILEKVKAYRLPRGRSSFSDLKNLLKDARELARDFAKTPLYPNASDQIFLDSFPVLKEAFFRVRRLLQLWKLQEGVLDFSDLEVHALRALERENVRRFYQERWKAFLVDEHQDTNRTQAAILEHLFGEDALITVVGDRKQAIYGFRFADVRVFEKLMEKVQGKQDGRLIVLEENYRTRQVLLDQVDRLAASFLEDIHQPLIPTRNFPHSNHPALRALLIKVKGAKKKKHRMAEARRVAEDIRRFLESETLVEEKGATIRPARLSDIAILTRTWNNLNIFMEALDEAGIPAVHGGGGNLLETLEARDGYVLLRFLANPEDNLALLALLRSPFFAVSDRTLQKEAHIKEKDSSWWDHLSSSGEFSRPHEVLAQLLKERGVLPPSHLLQVADDLTGYTAVLYNLPSGVRRLADWQAFIDLVRSLEKGREGIYHTVERLRQLFTAKVSVPRPVLGDQDAVQLLTIHGAKGLEWPVVYLVGLDWKGSATKEPVLFDPEIGVAFLLPDEKEPPSYYDHIYKKRQARQEQEERRLLYVALTRARDYLVLSAVDNSRKPTAASVSHGASASSTASPWELLREPLLQLGIQVEAANGEAYAAQQPVSLPQPSGPPPPYLE